MKIKWKTLVISVAIPLIVGGLSALLTRNSMEAFSTLQKPPLSPPGWLFPVVWTVLYILMGLASYLVTTASAPKAQIEPALKLYGWQLFFNFFWSLIFFGMQQYWFAFVWLLVLWVLIILTTISFYRISKPAAYLMIPYLIWVTFAAYLNAGIAALN